MPARPAWIKINRRPSRTVVSLFRGGLSGVALTLALAGCADNHHQIVVSVPEQRMVLLNDGVPIAFYPVSTSRFGLGDTPGSNGTPLGELEIAEKIGGGEPLGMKFKSRVPTGEIVPVDAPGRDPVVTRILWLRGLDAATANAYDRYIYIHGTPEERNVGHPASYGCVRMRSCDIAALYDEVGKGARVFIRDEPLAKAASASLARGQIIPAALATTAMPTNSSGTHLIQP